LGPPELLVNSAAGNFICPAIDLSPNGWRAVVDIVLNGTFYTSRAVARALRDAGRGGSILNIVATYAWTGNPGTVHSAAAKAGVLNLTRTLAVEWAPLGIRVNAMAPGPVDTEAASAHLFPTEEIRARMAAEIPAGRLGTLDDVVWAARFLLSPRSSYITGDCLTLDGGEVLEKGMFAHSEASPRG
jgi:NAD(P)-dependent dehydrogenase (short-subunit alcohol dehydrogenase family)